MESYSRGLEQIQGRLLEPERQNRRFKQLGAAALIVAVSLIVMGQASEYVRGDIHTNTAESTRALVKHGIVGIYHNVSREYLHRYLWQFDFMWNTRKMNDGERTVSAMKAGEGKRLMYQQPTGN